MGGTLSRSHDIPGLGDTGQDVYALILDEVGEGVYVTDRERRIVYWNRGSEEITGYEAKEAVGSRCRDNLLVHVDADGRALCDDGCPMAATLADAEPREVEVFLRHRLGHRVPVRVRARPLRSASGEIVAAVETFDSITEKMAALEQIRELEGQAYLDVLTGIANRRFLEDHLVVRSAEAERYGWGLGLIMMDIDKFKVFNDTYGHHTGDLVLQMVARTLRSATRSFDTVGRWGGEEFLAVVANMTPPKLERIANRYRNLVEKSESTVSGEAIHVSISAGATIVREGEDHLEALARADDLLYTSKRQGRNQVSIG